MPQDHLHGAVAGEPCRGHKAAAFERQRLTSRHARIFRPADDRQREYCVADAAAQHRRDRQGKDQPRKGQTHVRDAHHDGVHRAAVVAAERADGGSEDRDDADERQRGEDACLRADHNAGEHVAPVAVGAHPVLGRRREKRL